MKRIRNKKRKICFSLKSSTFQEKWKMILEKDQNKSFQFVFYDDYFENIYNAQSILEKEKVNDTKIDYSNYLELPYEKINSKNLYDCFHGIINFIYLYSQNKFNVAEIEIHFTNAKKYTLKNSKNFNIMSIFDYETITSRIDIEFSFDAFFGITFKRIKIQPVFYSIRSSICSNLISHLGSFTFEGFNDDNQRWDVLDERTNINDLQKSGAFCLFYVRSTHKCYSSFRIKQTGPGSNDKWGFSLSAFDIHGIIFYRDELKSNEESIVIQQNDLSFSNSFDFNPFIDMSNFLI